MSGSRAGAHKTGVPFLQALPAGFPLPGNEDADAFQRFPGEDVPGKQQKLGHRG